MAQRSGKWIARTCVVTLVLGILCLHTSPTIASVLDTSALTLVATVTTTGEYDNADLDTWNGEPLSASNQPTVQENQLSATWNFYVDPAASSALYVIVSNVIDPNYFSISGTPFNLTALTGFQFSLAVPSTSYAGFSNQFALAGEALVGPISGSSVPLTTTPGWSLVAVSGPTDDAAYQIEASSVSDAFTVFSVVYGDTRIFGGGVFEFTFDPSVDLLDVNFDTLNATATNGEGSYTETGTLTYSYAPTGLLPEPASLAVMAAALVNLGFLRLRRKSPAVASRAVVT